jgi:hypothetical protein
MRTLPALAAALSLLPAAAEAKEVAGVAIPDTAQVGGKTLALNGAGIRKRVFIKVYVGALYLEARSGDPEAIVAADAPKAVRMHFLRGVEKEKVLGAFREGFEKNSRATAAAAASKLEAVDKVLPPEVKVGQVLVVAYVPGAGSTVGLEGGASATVEGKEFADALFRNWIGKEPADEGLKEGMLGK